MGAEIVIELSTFILFLFGAINLIVLGPIAWILKSAIKDQKDIELRQENFEREVHLNYVRKDEYKGDMNEIKGLLRDIFEKLDGKADK